MRIATYSRISTDEERQPHSLGAQVDRLAAYCASQEGWRIVRRYEDQMTGTLLERPGLQAALADARSGRLDLLLVYRVDRLARSVRALAQILAELDEAGVGFRSVTEPFDTTTPAGRMMVQMLGVFAEFERATIIERITAGMERKARKGGWVPGTPPIGYRIASDTGFLEPVLEQGELVRRIFALYTEQRLGTRALANLLNVEGARTARGRLWSGAAVQAVLENPVYVGEIRWRGETFEAPHTSLVAREVFQEAQALLAERSKQRSKRRSNASDYLLSGKVRCGHCGAAMVGSAAHGRSGRYRYYTCFTRHRYGKSKGCAAERIPADALEEQLLALLASALADARFLERAVAQAASQADGERPRRKRELSALEHELAQVDSTRERYLAAFERGTLPEEQCGSRLRELAERESQLDERRRELQAAIVEAEPAQLDADAVGDLEALITAGLPGIAPSERKHVIGQLIESIEVRGRDWIKPTLRLPVVRIEGDEVERTGIEPVTSGLQIRSRTRPGRTRPPGSRAVARFEAVARDLARHAWTAAADTALTWRPRSSVRATGRPLRPSDCRIASGFSGAAVFQRSK